MTLLFRGLFLFFCLFIDPEAGINDREKEQGDLEYSFKVYEAGKGYDAQIEAIDQVQALIV